MSDSHLYLNLLDARAKSNLGSQRHARCEAGGEQNGGWDCRYCTIYFILYTLDYTILLNYILDGGWDCSCLPRQQPRMSRDIQKRQMNFFKVFFQFQYLRLVHSVIGVYEWKANEQAIANDYNYNLISNYDYQKIDSTNWIRAQLVELHQQWETKNITISAWALGIGHWACLFMGDLFPFPLRISRIVDATSATHRWHLTLSLYATLHITALQRLM